MSTPKKVRQYTIEEVDNLLLQAPKSRAVATVPAHLKKMSALQLSNLLTKICGIVSIAVPALSVIRSFLFLKPKWQKIIDDVISISSVACGTK